MEKGRLIPPPVPHVVIFPFPVHSHVHVMLNLAKILALNGFHITFLITEYARKSHCITEVTSRYPNFYFEAISDGLPLNHPRTAGLIVELFDSISLVTKSQFREKLESRSLSLNGRPPITCAIADGIMCFTIDIAKEFQLPTILFRHFSASCFWTLCCVPNLIHAGQLPLQGDEDCNMDKLVLNVPGMESFLRFRDLPSFCRANHVSDAKLEHVVSETHRAATGYGLILNTFEELERFSLAHIRTKFRNVYTIGPIHESLKTRTTSSGGQLREEETKCCMAWLDDRGLKSVVYVSFGNMVVLDRQQLMEFWHGLVNSGKPFLLVIPGNLVLEESEVPRAHYEGSEQREKTVNWAPQEQVLAHPAIGGFLTHSGWNSTLESICGGVPMICWPFYADQQVNSRLVEEVWKIGLDRKDTCDRVIVEKMVRELMDVRRDEFVK